MEWLQDSEVRNLQNAEEVKEYLAFRRTNDLWLSAPISRCSVLIAEEGEDADTFMKTYHISPKLKKQVEESMQDGFFLRIPVKRRYAMEETMLTLPVRYTALDTILDRAGIGGRTIVSIEERSGQRVLTRKRKAEILTEFMKLYDAETKLLFRDGKVSAMLSSQYAILPADELYEAIFHVLEEEYPMAELIAGRISHEYINFRWELKDEDMEEELRSRLEEFGCSVKEVSSGMSFITSDIGNTNASVYPFFLIDGREIRCGDSVEIKHMGKKTVTDFAKKLPKMNAMFKNSMEALEKLTSTQIRYPAGCLRTIASNLGLPKKISMKVAENMEAASNTCSAFDIYYALHLILDEYNRKPEASITTMLQIQEKIASALYLNYEACDIPFLWTKEN